MPAFKTILFDVDGTLLDSTELIYGSFEYTLQNFDFATPSREVMSKSIGKPLDECYHDFTTIAEVEELCTMHRHFQTQNPHLTKHYKHTLSVLRELQKKTVHLAAVTTRSRDHVLQSLNDTGIAPFLDAIITGSDVKNHKPHPEPILKALKMLDAKPQSAVMIGDTEHDVYAGKRAGVATVGVTYGFHGTDVLSSEPYYQIDDIGELARVVFG